MLRFYNQLSVFWLVAPKLVFQHSCETCLSQRSHCSRIIFLSIMSSFFSFDRFEEKPEPTLGPSRSSSFHLPPHNADVSPQGSRASPSPSSRGTFLITEEEDNVIGDVTFLVTFEVRIYGQFLFLCWFLGLDILIKCAYIELCFATMHLTITMKWSSLPGQKPILRDLKSGSH